MRAARGIIIYFYDIVLYILSEYIMSYDWYEYYL